MTSSLRPTSVRTTISEAQSSASAANAGYTASQPSSTRITRNLSFPRQFHIASRGSLLPRCSASFRTDRPLHAQAVAVAEVSGVISDPSGKFIVGAQVTLTDTDTKSAHPTVTEGDGHYIVSNLAPGPYSLEVRAPGFKDYRQTGIILEVAHNISINVAMTVGAVTETIDVSANASMVETKDSAIAQVMDEAKITELPLNGRNLTQLLTLTGGGTSAPAGDLTGSKNVQGSNSSGTFSVAGGQANGLNFLLDGGDNNDPFSNGRLADSVSGCRSGIQRADQRVAGAIRASFRRRGERGDQVGNQQVSWRSVRVSPQL